MLLIHQYMQKNYKTFIECIVVSAIVVFLIIHFAIRRYDNGSIWELETLWGDIGYTSAIVCGLAILFNWVLWRIPFVGRWLHTPNISGEWSGKGKSSFKALGVDGRYAVITSFYLGTYDALYGGEVALKETDYGYQYGKVPIYRVPSHEDHLIVMRKE